MTALLVLFVMWLLPGGSLNAEISLKLTPSQCFEPCTVRASVMIAGYELGREFCVAVYDDPTYAIWRSCRGWGGYKITDVVIGGLPAGIYRVVASLSQGIQDAKMLNVVGNFAILGAQSHEERGAYHRYLCAWLARGFSCDWLRLQCSETESMADVGSCGWYRV